MAFDWWTVVESRGGSQGSVPKVVERWGEPDSSRCVLAASFDDRKSNPVSISLTMLQYSQDIISDYSHKHFILCSLHAYYAR